MSPEPLSLSSRDRSAGAEGTGQVLDGEVLSPKIRVINPAGDQTSPDATPREPYRLRLGTALLAGALLTVLSGTGALEAYRWHLHTAYVAAGPSPTRLALDKLGREVTDLKSSLAATRADDRVGALKKSTEQLKAELDGLRSANAAAAAQLTAKLDKPAPSTPAIADIAAHLEKLDHDPRLSDLSARVERMEHQVASPLPTGSIVPQSRTTAGQGVAVQASSVPGPRASKPGILDNWIVRDVYSGIALVEARTGSVREVVPGEVLPGAGEVRSIERHGRRWIVVTSRGIIDTETW